MTLRASVNLLQEVATGSGFSHIDLIIDDFSDLINSNNLDSSNLSKIDKKLDKMRKSQSRARALRDAFLSHSSDEELKKSSKFGRNQM